MKRRQMVSLIKPPCLYTLPSVFGMESPFAGLLLTAVATVFLVVAAAASSEDIQGSELMRLHGGPPGVAWVVQVSDLHLSTFHPERSQSLRKLLGQLLAMIKPSLVLITGDLVDAKSKDSKTTRQDEAEWIDYNRSMHTVVKESGLPLQAFWDIHGNHDKYGVPYTNSPLDFFPRYSLSAHLNRSRSVHSLTLLGETGWRHVFVGLDQAMTIGLRGPSNLFGHPDDKSFSELDVALSEWDNTTTGTVTKHVFGHFPTSFTASTETGKRLELILAKHGVSGYVCGHLHAKFGKRLYRHHQVALRASGYSLQGSSAAEFWEWEMGDWRMSRLVRVMAIDNGQTSFTDFRLYGGFDFSNPENLKLPTVIVPTFPLDSRFMLKKSFSGSLQGSSIRALIFSPEPEVSVSVKILDKALGSDVIVYEHPMHLLSGYSGDPLFEAPWEPQRYAGASPNRYWLHITVTDLSNSILASDSRPFSVDNKDACYRYTWLEFFVMGFRWESFAKYLLIVNLLTVVIGILILPKILCVLSKRVGLYQKLVPNLVDDSWVTIIAKSPLWVLMEGVQNPTLWWSEMAVMVYLVLFPWFWGLPLAEGYPVGHMSMWGWTVKPSQTHLAYRGLGIPDNMNIVLPFLYTILFPCLLMGAALSAERAAHERLSRSGEQYRWDPHAVPNSIVKVTGRDCKVKPTVGFQKPSGKGFGPDEAATDKEKEDMVCGKNRVILKRRSRLLLFIGCLLVLYLHLRMCARMVASFGALAALASPGLAWSIPVLLIIGTCKTASLRT